MTEAWAVVENGQIDAKTVHPTKRGAMVNWLHVHDGPVFNSESDENIERRFAFKRKNNVSVERVGIRVLEAA